MFGINLEAARWTGLTQLGVSGDGRDAGRNTVLWIAGHGLLIKDILGIGNQNCDLVKIAFIIINTTSNTVGNTSQI